MPGIEWQETIEFTPAPRSLQAFCEETGALPRAPNSTGGVAAFVERGVLEALHEFLASDVSRERGGLLLGLPFYDPDEQCYFVDVTAAIPAVGTGGTPVHLQFTPEAWRHLSDAMPSDGSEHVVVGWYHSHPALGVFMSATDRATQRAFYNHPWNLAVVVDPIAGKTGWFAGGDCLPMDRDRVSVYERPPARTAGRETEAAGAGEARAVPPERLLWLLPLIGIALVVVLAMAWLIRQDRGAPETE